MFLFLGYGILQPLKTAALCFFKEVKKDLLYCFLTSEAHSDVKLTPNIDCQSNPEGILNGVTRVHFQQQSVLFVSQGIKKMILQWLLSEKNPANHFTLCANEEKCDSGTHTWVRNLIRTVFSWVYKRIMVSCNIVKQGQ